MKFFKKEVESLIQHIYLFVVKFFLRSKRNLNLLAEDLNSNNLLSRSEGMLYHTLLSIIPFLIVMIPFYKAFGIFDDFHASILVFLTNILGKTEAEDVYQTLSVYLEKGNQLGAYGFIIFAVSSSMLVGKIKKLFGAIYKIDVDKKRHFVLFDIFLYAVAVIIFALILTVVSFAYLLMFEKVNIGIGTLSLHLSNGVRKTFFYVFTASLYYILLIRMSDVYINSFSAFISSLAFIFQFFILRGFLLFLIQHFLKIKSYVYGSAISLVLLIIALNYLWKIIIISVDLAYVVQYKPNHKKLTDKSINGHMQNALDVMFVIVDMFLKGKGGARLSYISSYLGISAKEIIEICSKFNDFSLIHIIKKNNDVLYSPQLPVNEITVYYTLKAIEGDVDNNRNNYWIFKKIEEMKISLFLTLPVKDVNVKDRRVLHE